MAYSRGESTLLRMLPELGNVQQGRTQRWDVPAGKAWWKAAKIREALYIAREIFPHKYPRLAEAAGHFTVEVLNDTTVQARPTANTPATAISDGEGPAPSESFTPSVVPIHGLEPAGSIPRTIVGMKSATDIISYWLNAQPTNDKLVFTEAQLPVSEIDILARWAATRTPAWMVVASRLNPGLITLALKQPGVPAWGSQ